MSEERTGPVTPDEAKELAEYLKLHRRIKELEAKLDRAHGKMDMYFKMYEEADEALKAERRCRKCQ